MSPKPLDPHRRAILTSSLVLIAAFLGFIVAGSIHRRSVANLKNELAALRATIDGVPREDLALKTAETGLRPENRSVADNAPLLARVTSLETSVAELSRAMEYLMERGQIPLPGHKLEELTRTLSNPAATDAERLQALRAIRRSRAFTDEISGLAAQWLFSTTNSSVRADALEQLRGATNLVLRDPLLQLASLDPDQDVRENAIRNLQAFAHDPQVEDHLWKAAQEDTSDDVREEAREILVEAPLTDARAEAMRQRAGRADATLEDRLIAWEALRRADRDAPEIGAQLAAAAQATQDPNERLRLFKVFEDHSDPAFLPPLIQGLQDPNPFVREQAADALGAFRSDPTVKQWLEYLAQSDPDSEVRREAYRNLEPQQ